jgi:hypothetical protein
MGSKMSKSKSTSIVGKTLEDRKTDTNTDDISMNAVEMTSNDKNKPKEKMNKKRKQAKSSRILTKITFDKSTNTDNYIWTSSSVIEQCVDDSTTNMAQINAAYQSEISQANVQILENPLESIERSDSDHQQQAVVDIE